METTEMEPWYRWEGHSDYFCLVRLPVTKETAHGYVLSYYGNRKFVLKGSRKKFAYPTEPEAEANFIKRRTRHVKLLEAQLECAKRDLEAFAMPEHKENRKASVFPWSFDSAPNSSNRWDAF